MTASTSNTRENEKHDLSRGHRLGLNLTCQQRTNKVCLGHGNPNLPWAVLSSQRSNLDKAPKTQTLCATFPRRPGGQASRSNVTSWLAERS